MTPPFVPDGLSRATRRLPALDPATAPLDQRSRQELIARAPGYARLLNFFEADGSAAHDWTAFWGPSDPTFLAADIATVAGHGDEADFLQQIERIVYEVYQWYQWAQQHEAQDLAQPTGPLLQMLRTMIQTVLAKAVCALPEPQLRQVWERLDRLLLHSPAPAGWSELWGEHDRPRLTVQQVLSVFLAARQRMAQVARTYLEQALAPVEPGTGKHPAHAALYLAFLQLLETLQRDMNGFTARHLAYYYDDVLRLAPRTGDADRATVFFTLAAPVSTLLLKAGTCVGSAPRTGAKPLRYAVERDTQLSVAAIRALAAVRVVRGPSAGAAARAVYAAPVAASADGLGKPLAQPELGWPAFGPAPAPLSPAAAPLNANLGLIVASPLLLLNEGVRTVTLTLGCVPTPPAVTPATFRLYVSGAGGWQPVSGYLPRLEGEFLLLEFTLGEGAPPLVPNSAPPPKVPPQAPVPNVTLAPPGAGGLPMLMLLLNPDAEPDVLDGLQNCGIVSVGVDVGVTGLANLKLDNGGGPIAAGKPFAPFGAVPLPGAAFRLGHPELSAKEVYGVTVHARWLNLPLAQAPGAPALDFASYYAGYDPYTFANDGFKITAQVCRAGAWHALLPGAEAQAALFGWDRETGQLAPTSDWSLSPAPAAPPPPAPRTAEGTLQLTFAAPSYGFGQQQYPPLFAAQAVRNALQIEQQLLSSWLDQLWQALKAAVVCLLLWLAWLGKAAAALVGGIVARVLNRLWPWIKWPVPPVPPTPDCAPPAPPPAVAELNPPFVPMMAALTVGYHASGQVPLLAAAGEAQCFHVHPFGVAPLPPRADGQGFSLLPLPDVDGQLCIGLSRLTPGLALSLHVELRSQPGLQVTGGRAAPPPRQMPISWRYLARQGWRDFPAAAVASDTVNLSRSGIVTLQIPDDIDSGNPIMSAVAIDGADAGGISWIAVCVAREPDQVPATIALLPHAATALRVLDPRYADPAASVDKGSITMLAQPVAGIKSVSQPYRSHGGSAPESIAGFQMRVSERLCHKQRASLPRDYEQLVLAAHPDVWQVRCVGPNQFRGGHGVPGLRSGEVMLVVVPRFDARPEQAAPFSGPALDAIAAGLAARCATAVRAISVRNVSYELLKVTVQLRLKPDMDGQQCVREINAAIVACLSPWLRQARPMLELGTGEVSAAALASMICALPCVAEILGEVILSRTFQDAAGNPAADVPTDVMRPLWPWSVLVPQPQHDIGTGVLTHG